MAPEVGRVCLNRQTVIEVIVDGIGVKEVRTAMGITCGVTGINKVYFSGGIFDVLKFHIGRPGEVADIFTADTMFRNSVMRRLGIDHDPVAFFHAGTMERRGLCVVCGGDG